MIALVSVTRSAVCTKNNVVVMGLCSGVVQSKAVYCDAT